MPPNLYPDQYGSDRNRSGAIERMPGFEATIRKSSDCTNGRGTALAYAMATISRLTAITRRFVMDREGQRAGTRRELHRIGQAFQANVPRRAATSDPEIPHLQQRDGTPLRPSPACPHAGSNRLTASGQKSRQVESATLHPATDARSRNCRRASCRLLQGPP